MKCHNTSNLSLNTIEHGVCKGNLNLSKQTQSDMWFTYLINKSWLFIVGPWFFLKHLTSISSVQIHTQYGHMLTNQTKFKHICCTGNCPVWVTFYTSEPTSKPDRAHISQFMTKLNVYNDLQIMVVWLHVFKSQHETKKNPGKVEIKRINLHWYLKKNCI